MITGSHPRQAGRGGSDGEDLEGSVGSGFIPPTSTALQVPARCWGRGLADASLSKTVSPRHRGFLLPTAKRTDKDFCRKLTETTWAQGRRLWGPGTEGERGPCRDQPLHLADRPRGSLGTGLVPAGEGLSAGSLGHSSRPLRPRPLAPGAEKSAGVAAVGGPRLPRVVTGPWPRPHSPCAALGAERVLHSRGVAFHGRREENSLRLFLPPFSVAPICAPAPLPRRRPRVASCLPRRRTSDRCGAVAGVDTSAGGGACGGGRRRGAGGGGAREGVGRGRGAAAGAAPAGRLSAQAWALL